MPRLALLILVTLGASALAAEPDRGGIDARRYGVRCDGVTDDAAALNRALAAARGDGRGPGSGAGAVVLPAGVCRVADTIDITTTPYQTASLAGQGKTGLANGSRPMAADNVLGSGTALWCDFNDRPCLNITHARRVVIRDLAVIGNNFGGTDYPEPSDRRGDWVHGGALDRDEGPYCGICIDAYAGSDPGRQRGFGRARYTGENGGSGDVKLDNVYVARFVVPLMVSPRATTTNADDILVRASSLVGGVACLALGQSQSRNVVLESVALTGCRTALDGVTYGAGNGSPPKCYGCIFGFHYRLFHFSAATGSPLLLSGCHAESVKSLGIWGPQASGNTGMLIEGCSLSFGGVIPAVGWRRQVEPLALEAAGPVTITASTLFFNTRTVTPVINLAGTEQGQVSFVGSSLAGSHADNDRLFVGHTRNGSEGSVRFVDSRLQVGADTRLVGDGSVRRPRLGDAAGRVVASPGQAWLADARGVYLYQPGSATGHVAIPASARTLGADAIGFTATNPADVLPGDIAYWKLRPQSGGTYAPLVPACRVASVSGASVRCTLLYERERYDSVAATEALTGTGSVWLAVEDWAPARPLACTVTAGRRELAGCTPAGLLRDGDFITGEGLAPDTRVVARGTTASPVLSRPATASGTAVAVHFGRLLTPAGRPAF
jgi:hypothetical protein